MTSHGLVWFRKDLRLIDNPAWAAALDGCARITALFVLDPAIIDQTGPHRRAQLAAHLSALDEDLRAIGGHLWLLRGDPGELVPKAVEELGADALYANADGSRVLLVWQIGDTMYAIGGDITADEAVAAANSIE